MARKDNWYYSLPIVMLGFRMSPSSYDFSPFTAVTGSHILCPHPILSPNNHIPSTNDSIKMFVKEINAKLFRFFYW